MSLLETSNAGGCAELSSKGLDVLRNLDSRCFGFLGIQNGDQQQQQQQQVVGREGGGTVHHPHETNFVSRDFIHVGIKKLSWELSQRPQSPTSHAELLCRIGHLHLLLEEYKQAMSAYQHYQSLYPVESSSDVNFLYGMGLIYFHSNSYKWGSEVFQNVLRLSPSFARASECHLRLAVMFKKRGDYNRSAEHFREALCISGPSSFNKLEMQFHIGHLYFLQGNYIAAKETFETILSSKSVPNPIKALTLKQLGWLYHTVPEVGQLTPNPHAKATELLTLAVGADPTSSQAWYFLGRCHAHQGSIQEAFLAYQYAISKTDDCQADTWCSIGLLYHKMLQPKDSLQSYLCAVYLDSSNLFSWTNMGCLYEAMAQPVDAMLSYKNAARVIRSGKKCSVKCSEHVFSRMSNLEHHLSLLGASVHHQPHTLPSLYEGWTTLIPSNIRGKRSTPCSPILHLPILSPNISHHSHLTNFGPLPPTPNTPQGSPHLPPHLSVRPLGPPTKRGRAHKPSKDPIIIRNINEGWSKQSVMSPPSTPFLQSPGHASRGSGMRNRIAGMGMSQTGPGMNLPEGPRGGFGVRSGLPAPSFLQMVPAFDSIGHGVSQFGSVCYGSDLVSLRPPHSVISSFPPPVTPLDASSSSSHRHGNQPCPGPTQQLSVVSQESKLDSSIDSGTPPLPMQDTLRPVPNPPAALNVSSDYSVDYISSTSTSSPAGSSPVPLLPFPSMPLESPRSAFQRPVSATPPVSVAALPVPSVSPMLWELSTPSNSPMMWVSPVATTSSSATSTPSRTSPKSVVSPTPVVSHAVHNESGSGSSCLGMSPHSLPRSIPSEAPFSPLIGAGGMNSAFNASFSPRSLPNPVLSLYGSSSLNSAIGIPDDLSSVNPLKVSAEMRRVDDYLDRYLRNQQEGVAMGSGTGLGEFPRGTVADVTIAGAVGKFPLEVLPRNPFQLQGPGIGEVLGPAIGSVSDTPSHMQGSQSSPAASLAESKLLPPDGCSIPHTHPHAQRAPSHSPMDSLAGNLSQLVSMNLQVTGSPPTTYHSQP